MTTLGIMGIIVAVAAIVALIIGKTNRLQWLSSCALGAGLLLVGIGLRQGSVPEPVEIIDPSVRTIGGGERSEPRNMVPNYEPEKNRPLEAPERGYVSSASCQECHQHEHATWHASYHRTMTQVPDGNSVIGDFDNASFTNHASGISFLMSRSSNQYWMTISRTNQPLELIQEGGGGGTTMRSETGGDDAEAPLSWPVALMTGSHHMQGYWAPEGLGRTMSLLPAMYLREEQKWIPRSAVFLQPASSHFGLETGRWNTACVQCHAVAGKTATVEPFGYHETKVAEFGISCEACHGPGGQHVRLWQEAKKQGRKSVANDPIVNPVELSQERSSQVCGACHGRRERRDNFDEIGFKPGDDLNRTHLVFLRRPEIMAEVAKTFEPTPLASNIDEEFDHSFWRDGQPRASANEFNGLLESPCYQRGELTCFSCHQLHQSKRDSRLPREWANDQLRHSQTDDTACVQCHSEPEYASTRHTHHRAGSSGSACYNCHMPHTSYGLMKAIRAHQITSPDVAATVATTRPNACNLCHLDKSLEWTAEHLFEWYDIQKPDLSRKQKSYSAAALDVLQGDAGLRALAAWNMGWEPARQASGTDWMVPYLAGLLDDSYDTVRYIAWKSLKRIGGQENMDYDFVGTAAHRKEMAASVLKEWDSKRADRASRAALLIGDDGRFDRVKAKALLADRDNRPILLKE